MKDAYVTTKRGVHKLRQTIIGWEFLIERKGGSSSWMSLNILKESKHIEVTDYVTTLGLANEPEFLWWMPYNIKKIYHIIYLVNSPFRKHNHKFGIYIPNNIKEAISLDEKNGKTLWQDAYAKDMYQFDEAFKILQYGEHIPI